MIQKNQHFPADTTLQPELNVCVYDITEKGFSQLRTPANQVGINIIKNP